MQFGDYETTRRVVIHHVRRVISQYKKKYRSWLINESVFFIPSLADLNLKIYQNLPAFIKIHPIALSKSHFLIWTI